MSRLFLILMFGLVFLAGCGRSRPASEGEKEASYAIITQAEAKEIMDSWQDVIILDVRTQAEYDEGHIPGALLLPNESIGDQEIETLPDKEQTILIYCRSGNRSKQAAQKLVELGYTNVYEFGGIITWPYEIVE
ncbi:MAG TPA: rhodanese-like domain-containing protein [Clostridiales bacterium]|nr:rhodanese-like domain-containing protein [Clostridiales bacterium]